MSAGRRAGQGSSKGRTIIIPLHKCDVQERGGWGVGKCLGGRRQRRDIGRMNLNSSVCVVPGVCVPPADGPLCGES